VGGHSPIGCGAWLPLAGLSREQGASAAPRAAFDVNACNSALMLSSSIHSCTQLRPGVQAHTPSFVHTVRAARHPPPAVCVCAHHPREQPHCSQTLTSTCAI
jgi:hypothetical protein